MDEITTTLAEDIQNGDRFQVSYHMFAVKCRFSSDFMNIVLLQIHFSVDLIAN